jgi:hypothetical protein
MAAAESLNQSRGDGSGGFEDWFGEGAERGADDSGVDDTEGSAAASTSLMVGENVEPKEELMSLQPNECIQLWKDGLEVLKFGRKGQPHLRNFKLDEDNHSLQRRSWFREHFVPKFKEKNTSKRSHSPLFALIAARPPAFPHTLTFQPQSI